MRTIAFSSSLVFHFPFLSESEQNGENEICRDNLSFLSEHRRDTGAETASTISS